MPRKYNSLLSDSPWYHLLLWVLLLAALIVAIVSISLPRKQNIDNNYYANTTIISPESIAFLGVNNQINQTSNQILSLAVQYDYHNGSSANNYNGTFFFAPTTGIYHADLMISFFKPFISPSQTITFQARIDKRQSDGTLFPVPPSVRGQLKAESSPSLSDEIWYLATASSDIYVEKGQSLNAEARVVASSQSIWIINAVFSGHLVTPLPE